MRRQDIESPHSLYFALAANAKLQDKVRGKFLGNQKSLDEFVSGKKPLKACQIIRIDCRDAREFEVVKELINSGEPFKLQNYKNAFIADFAPGRSPDFRVVDYQQQPKAAPSIFELALSGNHHEAAARVLSNTRAYIAPEVKFNIVMANMKNELFLREVLPSLDLKAMLYEVCKRDAEKASLVCRYYPLVVKLEDTQLEDLLSRHQQFLRKDFAKHKPDVPQPYDWVKERLLRVLEDKVSVNPVRQPDQNRLFSPNEPVEAKEVKLARNRIEFLNYLLNSLDAYIATNKAVMSTDGSGRRTLVESIADRIYQCAGTSLQRVCINNANSEHERIPNDGEPLPKLNLDKINFETLNSNYKKALEDIYMLISKADSESLRFLLHELKVEGIDIGKRGGITVMMRDRMLFKNWDVDTVGDAQYITINQNEYRVLDGSVTNFNEPIASIGGNMGREIILFDPASPLLESTYQNLKRTIVSKDGNKDIEAVFNATIDFLQDLLNPKAPSLKRRVNLEDKVERLCRDQKFNIYQNSPLIPLDEFINKGTGVCRHHAMLFAYLLNRLQQDGLLPEGQIHHARDNTPLGRHVWVMYQPKGTNELYLADSLWRKFGNVNDPAVKEKLEDSGYGEAVDKCIDRFYMPAASAGARKELNA